jgi:hypothetical protein
MATDSVHPTSPASGTQQIDPIRGGRDQRRDREGRRRVKPRAADERTDEQPEPDEEATTPPRPHRIDVLA